MPHSHFCNVLACSLKLLCTTLSFALPLLYLKPLHFATLALQVMEDDIEYMAKWLVDELWNVHTEVMEGSAEAEERAKLMREVRSNRQTSRVLHRADSQIAAIG